jgi:hypothetical protein
MPAYESSFFWFISRRWQQQEGIRATIMLTHELDELLLGKDLKGSDDGLVEVSSGPKLGSVMTACVPAGIRTEHFWIQNENTTVTSKEPA